jgi:succinate dehydrogenase/fumarate reductase flavoprotein subunit
MILVVALKAAAAGIAATLAACSATNMYQTHQLLQLHTQTSSCTAATPASAETKAITNHDHDNNDVDCQLRSAQQTVDQLTRGGDSSGRRELLQLFLRSQAPTIDDIQGEWTGILLDNNSWVLVSAVAYVRVGKSLS